VDGYPGTAENAPNPIRTNVEVRIVNPDFIASGAAYPLKVKLPDGIEKKLHATNDFTVQEFLDLLMNELDMWQYEIWSLSRKGKEGGGCKTFIRDGDKFDTINVVWLDPAQTLEEAGLKPDDEIYLRVKYFKCYFKMIDPVAIGMYYAQVNSEVLSGLYPFTGSKVAVRLAALQLQIESGDFQRALHKPGLFTDAVLARFLPQRVIERNSSEYVQQRIFFYHRRLVGTSKSSAQLAYIVESRNMSTWGAIWYEGKLNGYKNQLARRIVIGVCEDGFAIPLKLPTSEEEEKQKTVSRRKLIENARTNSIMNLNTVLDAAELGMLQQKSNDDQYEFFPFHATYIEETKLGMMLKKKGEEVQLGLSKVQVNAIMLMSDSYMNILAHQNWNSMGDDEIPPASRDCPDYRLFELPMDRTANKKEMKSGKTMLEMLKENYIEVTTVAKKTTVSRLLLQIEAKLDERSRLEELDLRRCQMTDEAYNLISESVAATYQMLTHSSSEVKFKQDLIPSSLLLSYNDLVNPGGIGDMTSVLRISKLDLRSNNLTPKWAASFAKQLVKCTGLVEIYIGDNSIGNDGAIDIVNSLISLPAIRVVSLSNVGMENGALKRTISKISTGNNRGTMRGMPGGPGPEMGKVIASLVTSSSKLERLDVSDNVLTSRGVEFIVDALEKNDSLKARLVELNLGNTHISGSVGERLSSWITKTVNDSRNHLNDINLHANAFTLAACTLLSDLFTVTTVHLSHVDFSHLKIHVDGMSALLAGLEKNNTVKVISLAFNDISSKISKSLGHMIQNNSTIIKLSLRNCNMDKFAVVALGDAIAKNTAIMELDLAGNNFEAAACGASWEAALKKNKTITQLNIAACNLDGDSIDHLATALKVNRSLQMLHLDANYIGARGLKKLGHSIKDNHILRILSLQDVDCKYKDTCIFLQDVSSSSDSSTHSCGLQTLDLRYNSDLTANIAFIDAIKTHSHINIRYTPPKQMMR
jgi:Ran GTPase-activating protein (RanGAP) involved in mRNA processing and transport